MVKLVEHVPAKRVGWIRCPVGSYRWLKIGTCGLSSLVLGVTGAGGGYKRTPKSFYLVKILAKLFKIRAKSKISSKSGQRFEIGANSLNIWAKVAPTLIWNNMRPTSHAELFLYFLEVTFSSFFRESSGEFEQKSFAPQQFACSYMYARCWWAGAMKQSTRGAAIDLPPVQHHCEKSCVAHSVSERKWAPQTSRDAPQKNTESE